MNRTASNGYDTLLSLLAHTGDPLPLVLALDELDPDDPLTKEVAAYILYNAKHALVAAHTVSQMKLPADEQTKQAQNARLTRAGASKQERALLLGPLKKATPISPAAALTELTEVLTTAHKHNLQVTIAPLYRNFIARKIPGPPLVHISKSRRAADSPTHPSYTDRTFTLTVLPKDRRTLETLHEDILPHTSPTYDINYYRQYFQHDNQVETYISLPEAPDTDNQALIERLLKARTPNITITKS